MPKIQTLKFHNYFKNFGRDPPHECKWILGSGSDVYFQRKCRLKLLLPYAWSCVNEDKKKIFKKSKIWNFKIL